MPKREDIKSVLVIGSGPIVIGQACEFDYSGTQACRVLREEGIRVILVNSNPATIMTDPEFADATYVEPLLPGPVAQVIAKERPDALLPTLGGQTALNLAKALHEDGTLYTGDVAGVRIAPGRFVFAPTPPPEVDLPAWERSLEEIERRAPARLAVTHFGVFDDVERHLAALRETMHAWAERVAHGMDEPTFVAAARADVAASDPDEADAYDRAAPYWHCFLGLERYWRKRAEVVD